MPPLPHCRYIITGSKRGLRGSHAEMRAEWEAEVAEMRDRIQEMRELFVATLKAELRAIDITVRDNRN